MYTAYGIVTLYEWSWWSYVHMLGDLYTYGHHGHSYRVTIPYAVYIQFDAFHTASWIIQHRTIYNLCKPTKWVKENIIT
jgi:hypothetical protein